MNSEQTKSPLTYGEVYQEALIKTKPSYGVEIPLLGKKGTASFALIKEDMSYKTNWDNRACHSSMNNANGYDVVLDVLQTQITNEVDDNTLVKFFGYVMNRSMFADYFLSKDAEEVVKQGYTLRTLHAPSNLLQMSMILTRVFEYPDMINNWYKLTEAGCQEDVAIVLADYLCIRAKDAYIREQYSWGHKWWNGMTYSVDAMSQYINNKPEIVNKTSASGAGYAGVHTTFSSVGMRLGTWLVNQCNAFGKESAPSTYVNPFGKARHDSFSDGGTFKGTEEQVISMLVTIGNKYYKEHKS